MDLKELIIDIVVIFVVAMTPAILYSILKLSNRISKKKPFKGQKILFFALYIAISASSPIILYIYPTFETGILGYMCAILISICFILLIDTDMKLFKKRFLLLINVAFYIIILGIMYNTMEITSTVLCESATKYEYASNSSFSEQSREGTFTIQSDIYSKKYHVYVIEDGSIKLLKDTEAVTNIEDYASKVKENPNISVSLEKVSTKRKDTSDTLLTKLREENVTRISYRLLFND